mmetsp:Transcript_12918/g.28286  ORF Transcript_12918/g.28286 Transcript_12918/m.28286 type:complete len:230 (-) Transcript_12918:1279-1968(-)
MAQAVCWSAASQDLGGIPGRWSLLGKASSRSSLRMCGQMQLRTMTLTTCPQRLRRFMMSTSTRAFPRSCQRTRLVARIPKPISGQLPPRESASALLKAIWKMMEKTTNPCQTNAASRSLVSSKWTSTMSGFGDRKLSRSATCRQDDIRSRLPGTSPSQARRSTKHRPQSGSPSGTRSSSARCQPIAKSNLCSGKLQTSKLGRLMNSSWMVTKNGRTRSISTTRHTKWNR